MLNINKCTKTKCKAISNFFKNAVLKGNSTNKTFVILWMAGNTVVFSQPW